MKKIICSYAKDCIFGFGDFLRGCMCIRGFCKQNDIDFELDFSQHKISNYIKSSLKPPPDYVGKRIIKASSLNENRLRGLLEYDDQIFLCSNTSKYRLKETYKTIPGEPKAFFNSLDEETRSFFKKNLNFSQSIIDEAKKRLKDKKIKNFSILQIRTGDAFSFSDGKGFKENKVGKKTNDPNYVLPLMSYVDFAIKYAKSNKDTNFVFISDSSKLKLILQQAAKEQEIKNLNILSTKATHTSDHMLEKLMDKPIKDGFFETILEMYLISLSDWVKCYTCYRFPSNFSRSISLIFGIDHKVGQINPKDV